MRGLHNLHAVVEEVVGQVADASVAVAALDMFGVRAEHDTRGCLYHEQTVVTLFSFHVRCRPTGWWGGLRKGEERSASWADFSAEGRVLKALFWERSGEVCQLLVEFLFFMKPPRTRKSKKKAANSLLVDILFTRDRVNRLSKP